tara:strand:+ start:1626 stop:2066 length:441 start_codon:yes stop_codon:yes gene_type:complete
LKKLLIFFFLNKSLSSLACEHSQDKFNCIEYVDNYDGDTVTVNIPNIHPFFGKNAKIRLDGIDTPELRSKNYCEKELAARAKKFVKSLLESAQTINLKKIVKGKYFRIVGELTVDGKNISDILVAKNLAIPYSGKTKQIIDWCKFL